MNIKEFFKKIFKFTKDIIYPDHIKCIFCDDEIKTLNEFDCCEKCSKTLPYITNSCVRCGTNLFDSTDLVCFNCKHDNHYFDRAFSVFDYDDKLKSVIHNLKYHGAIYVTKPLGNYLVKRFKEENIHADIVTFVPLHPNRRKTRGYNQAEELAKNFAEKLNLELIDIFERKVDSISQTELSPLDRKKNVKDIFKLKYHDFKEKDIVIIDDVMTTGSTVDELAKLLKTHGANKVYVLTVAHSISNPKI